VADDVKPTGGDGSRTSPSPQIQLLRTVYAAITARLLTIVTALGVPDLLADGARPVQDLASVTGSDPDALSRVLRTLASVGIFTETAPGSFGLTELATPLRSAVPGSIRDVILELGSAETYSTLAEFPHSLRTGEPSFDQAYGTDMWSYLREKPERAEVFNRTQAMTAREVHTRALGTYDLSRASLVVDVGGGHGDLIARVLTRYPHLTGVVFDRPEVVEGARSTFERAGVADRARVVGGDFFEFVPSGGDVYVMSMILHDWPDALAAKILRNVRVAMAPGARLLVIDALIPPGDTPHPGKFIDIMMLMNYGSRERTEQQLAQLFASAGLRLVETRSPTTPSSLIVAEADSSVAECGLPAAAEIIKASELDVR
jgi:hypothetical protein